MSREIVKPEAENQLIRIVTYNSIPFKCMRCHVNLVPDKMVIPLNETRGIRLRGFRCVGCGTFYTESHPKLKVVLEKTPGADRYELNGRRIIEPKTLSKKRKAEMQGYRDWFWSRSEYNRKNVPSSAIIEIVVEDRVRGYKKTCLIVTSKEERSTITAVYHYTEGEARELLAAAFCEQKKNPAKVGGREVAILSKRFMNGARNLPSFIDPTGVFIQPKGGTYEAEYMRYGETIDILLYSPYSDRYEIMRATEDRIDHHIFSDIRLYRDFVELHGNPKIEVYPVSGGKFDSEENLNAESILHAYGYNLSDGLSEYSRQKILAEVMDLEILDQYDIVRLLDFFIHVRKKNVSPTTLLAWRSDRAFVLGYRVDPSRFLIARSK